MQLRSLDHKVFYVYIVTNRSGTLYTGVTNDLARRMREHKSRALTSFAARYRIDRLLYFEQHDEAEAAIAREKQLKGWLRIKKITLIESMNADWKDLSQRINTDETER